MKTTMMMMTRIKMSLMKILMFLFLNVPFSIKTDRQAVGEIDRKREDDGGRCEDGRPAHVSIDEPGECPEAAG